MVKKPVKTISGVAPVSVMIPPRRCNHGACTYCPTLNAPQSYTPQSPAVLRAKACEYDPYKQVIARLNSLERMGHPIEKIELIIMGGTFLSFPKKFCYDFIAKCYAALNDYPKKVTDNLKRNLEEEKKKNETAKHRCVALCIETRPDVCSQEHIKDILNWGATRVELGVQIIDDEIYKKINRCHKVADVISATTRLKKAGFKIGYHLMPGLPGSNPDYDLRLFKKIFSDENFRPDQIKIYPCQVLKGAKLAEDYFAKKYIPYTKEEAFELILNMLKITPNYCRIMRIMREIPPHYLIAGIKNIDLRKEVEEKIKKEGIKINEIRFREVGFAIKRGERVSGEVFLKITNYLASEGKEFFIEVVNDDYILFGLLRLRIDGEIATVRELHVYGPSLEIGKRSKDKWQHRGLGKKLMEKAEEISKENKCKKLRIISGVGVREYYRKIGYKIDDNGIYMEKFLR